MVAAPVPASTMTAVKPTSGAWRAEAKATLVLGLPLVGSQLAHIAQTSTDVLMMGWVGPETLAAGSLGFNLWVTLFVFAMGVAYAAGGPMAQARGARRPGEIGYLLPQSLIATTLVALPLALLLTQSEQLLLLFGQTPENAAAGGLYALTMAPSFLLANWFITLRGFMATYGHTRIVLVVAVLSVPLNAVLVYAFLFGRFGAPELGLVGVGLATSLVSLLSFMALAGYVVAVPKLRRHLWFPWRPDWERIAMLLKLGLPIGTTLLLEVSCFSGAVMLMGILSTEELAAHQIAVQWASMTFMVPMGLAQAATVRVGYSIGAGDMTGARLAAHVALVLSGGFMLAAALIFWFVPGPLVAVFIDGSTAPLVASLAATYLAIAAIFQLVDSTQAVGAGSLRGLKDTRWPMIIAAFGYWLVGFPIAAFLGFWVGWRGVGVWIGLAIGLAVTAALIVGRFEVLTRKPLRIKELATEIG
ncbi:MAG: MATE family efflux transporter [Alphaproteobacteria bacterium]|nr:MATE family efflux transporter [Alphaproteobacteria bacterium]